MLNGTAKTTWGALILVRRVAPHELHATRKAKSTAKRRNERSRDKERKKKEKEGEK